jgi:formylglycine-generating enzyme required for sulfatase activity/uncharacterized protein YjdB
MNKFSSAFLILVVGILALACGRGASTDSSSYGSLEVKPVYKTLMTRSKARSKAIVLPDEVSTITISVWSAGFKNAETFTRSAGSGTVNNIPVGAGYSISFEGKDTSSNRVVYGEVTGVDILGGGQATSVTIPVETSDGTVIDPTFEIASLEPGHYKDNSNATLNENVKTMDFTSMAFNSSGNVITLTGIQDYTVADILKTDQGSFKVSAVSTFSGNTVLVVENATIFDLFKDGSTFSYEVAPDYTQARLKSNLYPVGQGRSKFTTAFSTDADGTIHFANADNPITLLELAAVAKIKNKKSVVDIDWPNCSFLGVKGTKKEERKKKDQSRSPVEISKEATLGGKLAVKMTKGLFKVAPQFTKTDYALKGVKLDSCDVEMKLDVNYEVELEVSSSIALKYNLSGKLFSVEVLIPAIGSTVEIEVDASLSVSVAANGTATFLIKKSFTKDMRITKNSGDSRVLYTRSSEVNTPTDQPTNTVDASIDFVVGFDVRATAALKFAGVLGPYIYLEPYIEVKKSFPDVPQDDLTLGIKGGGGATFDIKVWGASIEKQFFNYYGSWNLWGDAGDLSAARDSNRAPVAYDITVEVPADDKFHRIKLPFTDADKHDERDIKNEGKENEIIGLLKHKPFIQIDNLAKGTVKVGNKTDFAIYKKPPGNITQDTFDFCYEDSFHARSNKSTVTVIIKNDISDPTLTLSSDGLKVTAKVSLDKENSSINYKYIWGDGTTTSFSTASSSSHTYSQSGRKNIQVEISNGSYYADILEKSISIGDDFSNSAPNAQFSVTKNVDNRVTFDASAISDDSDSVDDIQIAWDWDDDGIPDTNYSATKVVTHAFQRDGSYNVTVYAVDTDGNEDTYLEKVAVGHSDSQDLKVEVSASELRGINEKITLYGTAQGAGNAGSFLWEQVSGPSYTISNPTHSNIYFIPTLEGVYVFKMTVTNGTGESASKSVTITIAPKNKEFRHRGNNLTHYFTDTEKPTISFVKIFRHPSSEGGTATSSDLSGLYLQASKSSSIVTNSDRIYGESVNSAGDKEFKLNLDATVGPGPYEAHYTLYKSNGERAHYRDGSIMPEFRTTIIVKKDLRTSFSTNTPEVDADSHYVKVGFEGSIKNHSDSPAVFERLLIAIEKDGVFYGNKVIDTSFALDSHATKSINSSVLLLENGTYKLTPKAYLNAASSHTNIDGYLDLAESQTVTVSGLNLWLEPILNNNQVEHPVIAQTDKQKITVDYYRVENLGYDFAQVYFKLDSEPDTVTIAGVETSTWEKRTPINFSNVDGDILSQNESSWKTGAPFMCEFDVNSDVFITGDWSYKLVFAGGGNTANALYGSFKVTGEPVLVTISGTNKVLVGSTSSLSAITKNGSLTASHAWTSADPNIATVDESTGIVTGIASGTVTVTAKDTANGNAEGTYSVQVYNPSISLISSVSIIDSETKQLVADTLDPMLSASYTYSSSDSQIASVSPTGLITGVSVGSTTMTVTDTANNVSATVGVTIDPIAPTLVLTSTATSALIGEFITLNVTTNHSVATPSYVFSSSPEGIVTVVNSTRVLTGIKTGTTIITATDTANNHATAEISITITAPDPIVTLTGVSFLDQGQTATLSAFTENQQATPAYSWSSSDTSVLTVESAKVTPVSGGTAVVTVVDTANAGASATHTMTVSNSNTSPPVYGLTMKLENSNIKLSWVDFSSADSYNIYWDAAAGVTNSSTRISTASNAKSYTQTGLSSGVKYFYRVAAVRNGVEGLLSTEKSILYTSNPTLAIYGGNIVYEGEKIFLTSEYKNFTTTPSLIWSSSRPSVASIDSNTGEVTGVNGHGGDITITLATIDGIYSTTKEVSVGSDVVPRIEVSGVSSSVAIGGTLSLTASVKSSSQTASFVWGINDSNLASLSTNAGASTTLTGLSAGAVSVAITDTVNGLTRSYWVSVNTNSSTVSSWVWRNPLPQGNSLNDVVYNGSIYCAVGANGTILTSSDGTTWAFQTLETSPELKSIAWNGTQFCAVGYSGAIFTSSDGTTWASQTSGTSNALNDIMWNGTQFCAVGSNGTILTSSDGTTWTIQFSGTSSELKSVAWSGTKFCVVGFEFFIGGNKILTSSNGITWNPQTSGSGSSLYSIIWNGTQFIAVGASGTIISSSNGTTWSSRSSGTSSELNDIAWSGTKFCVVGSSGRVLTSSDGTAWASQSSGTSSYISGVTWSGTKFYAVGPRGMILTSSNASSWSSQTTGVTGEFRDITWSGTQFCAVALNGGNILTSPDGVNWTSRAGSATDRFEGVTWNDTQFCVVGNSGAIQTSTDGISWTDRTLSSRTYLGDVTWGATQFCAVGDGAILTSPDAINWTTRTSGTSSFLNKVVWNGSQFCVVGDNGTILTSTDGTTWTLRASNTSNHLSGVTWSGSLFCAVGASGTILTSTDGISWTVINPEFNYDLKGVVWAASKFYAVGSDDILSSSDGISWQSQRLGANCWAIASDGTQLCAVGSGGAILTQTLNGGTSTSATNGSYLIVDISAGSTATSYTHSEVSSVPSDLLTNSAYKSTKIVLRKITAGTFLMGSNESEVGRNSIETQHAVTLTRNYFMSVFEVTQDQYAKVMGAYPSRYTGSYRPVDSVSWEMARGGTWSGSTGGSADPLSFMGKMAEKTGLSFDLPTEAQWEYACRAGTTTGYHNGKDCLVPSGSGQDINLDTLAHYVYNNFYNISGAHSDVATKQPNAWGLYDMHGNVKELCLDFFHGPYDSSSVTDPKGVISGSSRVQRGGGWISPASYCRSAKRGGAPFDDQQSDIGFRLSLTVSSTSNVD